MGTSVKSAPRDQHIAEAGVEGKSPLQHGILKVGACHHSGVQGGFAQVGAAEIGILQLGAVEAGSPKIRTRTGWLRAGC